MKKNTAVEHAPDMASRRKSLNNPSIDMNKYDRRGKQRTSTLTQKLSKLLAFQRNSVAPQLPPQEKNNDV